jgi:Flp pilus assembly protein TadD
LHPNNKNVAMKKKSLIVLSLAAVTSAMIIPGCKLVKDIEYKVQKNPLEMHADTVELKITAKFIEKGLNKKATVEVTPVLVTPNGTEKAFKMACYQGPKAAGNCEVVPKEGKTVSYTARIPYSSDIEVADLKIKVLPKKGTKEKDLIVTEKIADATIVTPLLIVGDDKPIYAKDKFVRVTSHTTEMVFNYLKNDSKVLAKELKDKDYLDLEAWFKKAMANPRIAIKNISLSSYASPEGELTLNDNLANERAASSMKAVIDLAKKLKFDALTAETVYSKIPKGEDWDGFKKLMEASSITDKELILRVLTMTSDLQKREAEIKNMAKTYKEIEDQILPQLRRSVVVVSYDLTGKTDEELMQWSKTKADSLTVEELLFTATLTNDLNEKLRIYKEAARVHGKDWRTSNNVGYILLLQGKVGEAKAEFEKAAKLNSSEKMIKNNLAACARLEGDYDKATALLKEAEGAGPEVDYNKGIIAIKRGKYADAVTGLGKSTSIESTGKKTTANFALAQILNGQAAEAKKTLDGAVDGESATAHYLRAIIGARTNDKAMLAEGLKNAIAKDSKFKEKAKKDREFIKFAAEVDAATK